VVRSLLDLTADADGIQVLAPRTDTGG